jgi:hypothetical protein
MPARRLGTRGLTGGVVAVVAVLVAGCGGDGGSSQLPTPRPEPETTVAVTPTVDPEHAAVIAAYEQYVQVTNEAANQGEPEFPELTDVAAGPALAEAQNAIREHAENGRRYTGGRQVVSAAVTKLDVDAPQGEPQAVLEACLDISNYVLTYVDSGEPVDVDRGLEEFMVTAELYLIEDRWVVVAAEAHQETPCE